MNCGPPPSPNSRGKSIQISFSLLYRPLLRSPTVSRLKPGETSRQRKEQHREGRQTLKEFSS